MNLINESYWMLYQMNNKTPDLLKLLKLFIWNSLKIKTQMVNWANFTTSKTGNLRSVLTPQPRHSAYSTTRRWRRQQRKTTQWYKTYKAKSTRSQKLERLGRRISLRCLFIIFFWFLIMSLKWSKQKQIKLNSLSLIWENNCNTRGCF
jgi:hypothetical protein